MQAALDRKLCNAANAQCANHSDENANANEYIPGDCMAATDMSQYSHARPSTNPTAIKNGNSDHRMTRGWMQQAAARQNESNKPRIATA